jgi:hypothetical protein
LRGLRRVRDALKNKNKSFATRREVKSKQEKDNYFVKKKNIEIELRCRCRLQFKSGSIHAAAVPCCAVSYYTVLPRFFVLFFVFCVCVWVRREEEKERKGKEGLYFFYIRKKNNNNDE